jgi:AAA domain
MSTTPNSFSGMDGIPTEQLKAEDQLRIALLGKPKSGKTTLASTARKPMRFYDHDNRKETLEGKEGIYVVSRPTMLQVETDLSIMKANKIRKSKGENITLPATIVHDSVTYMNRAMEEEIFRQDPKLARLIRVGNNTTVKIRNSWDVINGIQRYIEYLVAEYTNLGVDLIFVFHEKDEKDRTESSPGETKYTGLVTTDPQYLQNSLSLFNEVYRITVDGKRNYQVAVKTNYEVTASTTMLLDPFEQPDIMAMIAKHQAAREKLKFGKSSTIPQQ